MGGIFDVGQEATSDAPPHRPKDERLIAISDLYMYIYTEDINWWLVKGGEKQYLGQDKVLKLADLSEVKFSADTTPIVSLAFKGDEETKFCLTFSCDNGR